MESRYTPSWIKNLGMMSTFVGQAGEIDVWFESKYDSRYRGSVLCVGPPSRKLRSDRRHNYDGHMVRGNQIEWRLQDIHVELAEMREIYNLMQRSKLLEEVP